MQFAIGVTVLECSFVKHSHGPLGVNKVLRPALFRGKNPWWAKFQPMGVLKIWEDQGMSLYTRNFQSKGQ
jgi:hypothetical protein